MDPDLRDRRVLVTGADGRIGSAVVEHFIALGAHVTGIDTPEVDTTRPAAVVEVMADIELVVHLAAIPHPDAGPWRDVFADNVVSTFNVLSAAAEAGVQRAMIASSINASGVPMNSHQVLPAYYPFDERLPADIDDPYSLSKAVDEATAAMTARHWGLTVVAIRFPFTAASDDIVDHAAEVEADLAGSVRTGWTYLDVRDAARAVALALTRPLAGAHTIFVAADETLVPYPTEALLDRFAPDVPRLARFVGREVPADLTRARQLLGFRAEHTLSLEQRPLR